jgi:CHASE1-domain containing sensor protein
MLRPDPLLRRRGLVYALEWLPLVRENERAAYETEARAAGLAGFRFWELGHDGSPVTANRRPFYVPIQYMEPPNAGALGFDVASEPVRWHVAERARDSGMASATLPFQLVQDKNRKDASSAVAVYAPVYKEGDPGSEEARRAAIAGWTIVIFRGSPLVDNAVAMANSSGLGLVMRDGKEADSPLLAERPPNASKLPTRPDFSIGFSVLFADRRWSLNVFALPGAFLPARRGAVTVALAGVLASLLGLVVVTALRTISRLRHQAEKVGPYRLIARLGHGAMGVVWEARHALLRRPTAVKLLAPGTEGERALARFEREVQLTAGLTHPSTIAIYDYGRTADGVFYYAMELLRGINLLQLVDLDGPLPPGRVVHLLRQACGALAEAHAAGLIHRDIKPANLMICLHGGVPDFLKDPGFRARQGHRRRRGVARWRDRRRRRRRRCALAGRLSPRHSALHGARGDERSVESGLAGGPLRARRRRLLPADRSVPVSGTDGDRGLSARAAGTARRRSRNRVPIGSRRLSRRPSSGASPSGRRTGRNRPTRSMSSSRVARRRRPGASGTRASGGMGEAARRSKRPSASGKRKGRVLFLATLDRARSN